MLALFIGLLVWNLISGIFNLVGFGKTDNPFTGIVGGLCLFTAGVLSTIVFLKSLGVLP